LILDLPPKEKTKMIFYKSFSKLEKLIALNIYIVFEFIFIFIAVAKKYYIYIFLLFFEV